MEMLDIYFEAKAKAILDQLSAVADLLASLT